MSKKLIEVYRKRAALAKEGVALTDKMSADGYEANDADTAKLTELQDAMKLAEIELDKVIADDERAAPFAARDDADTIVAAGAGGRVIDDKPGMMGFEDITDFALAVYKKDCGISVDPRLAATSVEGGSTTGDSFMVPPEMSAGIFELAVEQTDLFGMTFNEVTSRNQVQKLVDDSTPYSTNGVQAGWRAELDTMTGSNLHTEPVDVKLHQLFAFAEASEELLEDVPLLNSRLSRGATQAIAWKLDDGVIRGTGVGQLAGYLNSDALVTQAKESGQSADTVVADNVTNMFTRMYPNSINRASWIANINILPQLMSMTIGDQPVYIKPAGLADAPHGLLLGRPIIYTAHANTLGDVGDLVFADLQGYYTISKASGVKFAESIHLKFDTNEKAFRWLLRVGGQTMLDAPTDPEFGSTTMSHFVALAERA